MSKKSTAPESEVETVAPPPAIPTEGPGAPVIFWHDRDTSVPATITALDGDRADLQFESALNLNGHNHGITRQKVRCGYGAKTPGTWSYPDPQPPPSAE